jgi:hypothetical protein
MTMLYQTKLAASRDGSSTVCYVDAFDGRSWRSVGVTRAMHTYPQASRARTAGESLARRFHRSRHPQLPLSIVKA